MLPQLKANTPTTAIVQEPMDEPSGFLKAFPPMPRQDLAPQVTWAEIERQLTFLGGLTDRPSWEIDLLRKEVEGEPPEFFVQRLLSLAWAIIDDASDTRRTLQGGGMN